MSRSDIEVAARWVVRLGLAGASMQDGWGCFRVQRALPPIVLRRCRRFHHVVDLVTSRSAPADSTPALPWANFGLRLREARQAAGLTQSQLAGLCGKEGNSWISMLEKVSFPRSLDDVALLADKLNANPVWLLTGVGPRVPGQSEEEAPLAVVGAPGDLLKAMLPRQLPELVGASGKRHFLVWAGAVVNPKDLPIRHGLLLCELKQRAIPGGMPAVLGGSKGFCYEPGRRAAPGRIGHVVVGMFAAPSKRWRPEDG